MDLKANHIPLRIEWRFLTPWVPPNTGKIHLDGLIGNILVERVVNGPDGSAPLPESYQAILAELPFARHTSASGEWVWCASMLHAEVLYSERAYLTSKAPALRIAELVEEGVISRAGGASVDQQRGHGKAASLHFTTQHVRKVTAWCVGDPDEIADLLGDIDSMGGRRNKGYGQLAEVDGQLFSMTEDAAALALWKWRVMPDLQPGYVPFASVLRPPYWSTADRPLVAYPFDDPLHCRT